VSRNKQTGERKGNEWCSPELRQRAVKEVVESGAPVKDVARLLGVSPAAVTKWVTKFRRGGLAALTSSRRGRPSVARGADARRGAVVEVKRQHPALGTRRISDVLARFEAIGVSPTTVRRILHEEGLLKEKPPKVENAPRPETRFERAGPNQLWQSDIFTFLLRRHERLYVTVFMDDYSRFVVGHAIAHHQKSALVMEAFEKGVAAFGVPQEALTDNGRQYTAWRGETEFEAELKRQGIKHIKSRPHHPQTLGKVERFWKTLWDEFLSRTVFADFSDLLKRFELFVHGYNFQRPHQGIGGLVPADRFFRAAPQVRAAIETNIEANATRMALQQPVRKPFYLVGQLGDQNLSIAASGGELRVQMGDDEPRTIPMPREESHETVSPSRFGEIHSGQAQPPSSDSTGAAVAEDSSELGRSHRSTSLPADAVSAERREAGDGRDNGSGNLEAALLPARREGAAGDVEGPFTGGAGGSDGSGGSGIAQAGSRGTASAHPAIGNAEAPSRAAAAFDEEDLAAGPDEDRGSRPAQTQLDPSWAQAFANLGGVDDGRPAERILIDEPWRDDALTWERKLAGADAPREGAHGEEEKLRARAVGARGDSTAVPGGTGSPVRGDDGLGGSATTGLVAESFSNADAPWPEWLGGENRAATTGSTGEAAAPGGARGESGETREGERESSSPSGDGGSASGSSSGLREGTSEAIATNGSEAGDAGEQQ
jgi:transposase InsO family protein